MTSTKPPVKSGKKKAALRGRATIVNQRGLHARAAGRVAQLAESFDADLTVHGNGQSASALSIMDLLLLAAAPGTPVEVSGTGKGAKEAISAVIALIEAGFDED